MPNNSIEEQRRKAQSVLRALEQEAEAYEAIDPDPHYADLLDAKLEHLTMRISKAQQVIRALGGRIT